MRPTGNHSRDLACLELPNNPPCPPPLVKQKRNAEGPPLTLVRAVMHSATASVLTSSWLKYPTRPVALHPPPFCYHHYLLILYADLFHFIVFSSLLNFQTLLRAQDRGLITLKCLKIQLTSCDPDCGADHNVTLVIPCGAHTQPPQHDPNLTTPSTYPPLFLHADDKEEEDEGEVTTAERLTESLIKSEL